MSRRRSSSTAVSRPGEINIVMDPPQGPAPSSATASDKELVQKYRTLKRRYHELEEAHKETSTEPQRSGERNVKMREEQSRILETINSLESEHPGIQDISPPASPGSVFQATSNMRNGSQRNSGSLAGSVSSIHTSPSSQPAGTTSISQALDQPFTASSVQNASTSSLGQPDQSSMPGSSSHPYSSMYPPPHPQNLEHQQHSSEAVSMHNGINGEEQTPNSAGTEIGSSSRPPASGPSRSTRRSSRVAAADHTVEAAPKTRGSAKRKASSPVAKTRTTRRESAALAAAVVKAAEAEAASSSSTSPQVPIASSASGVIASSSNSSDPNIDPSLVSTDISGVHQRAKEPSPMDNIVKVAEAAVAAQQAANNNSQTASAAPSTSASPAPSQSPSATSATTSASSTSYNPYMITTQMVPGKLNTNMMPLSMNPYAMYYAPGTPVTPGASPYSPYSNPYYYLTAPVAGPSGMYPSSPNFAQPNAQRPPSDARQAKPKRLKAHTVTSKSFSIPMVPRDKRGKPMLPLNVGIMTVISLGDVCMREHFHTERYIFPVGYEVTRRYLSTVDPNIEVVYHCTILDGGDGPKFQIVPSDVPDRPVIAGTATGAWSSIVKQANAIRNRQHSNSVSGPDFFGLGQNTIKHLIQELPNADRLRDYVWQTFVEGGPLGGRHAAVIPALPEEYDASMPIGAYYPTERDKRKREGARSSDAPTPKGISYYPQHIIAQAEAQRAQQQALQQAQQIGAQPLQPGTPGSGLEQQQTVPSPPGPQIDNNVQEYRPQLATSADRTPQAPDDAPPGISTTPLPAATFASIMNAYSSGAVSGTPTPAQ